MKRTSPGQRLFPPVEYQDLPEQEVNARPHGRPTVRSTCPFSPFPRSRTLQLPEVAPSASRRRSAEVYSSFDPSSRKKLVSLVHQISQEINATYSGH